MSALAIVLVRGLIDATAPWHSLFNQSTPVEMLVVGIHVLSMLVAAGLAIAYDRSSLRASSWQSAFREHHVVELHAVHRVVVAALAICMASGLALFASDVKTYVGSVPFWIKMALIVALLCNAILMTANETSLRVNVSGTAAVAWARVRVSSVVSIILWAAIVSVSIVLSLSK
jgi:hypothetical protein